MKPEEVVLASSMEGMISHKGQPASGITLTRRLSWYSGEHHREDSVVTSDEGHFVFPIVTETVKTSGLVHFSITQEIMAIHDDKEIILWTAAKHSKTEYGELGGKPVNLRCELTDDEERFDLCGTSILTRFRWDRIDSDVCTSL